MQIRRDEEEVWCLGETVYQITSSRYGYSSDALYLRMRESWDYIIVRHTQRISPLLPSPGAFLGLTLTPSKLSPKVWSVLDRTCVSRFQKAAYVKC